MLTYTSFDFIEIFYNTMFTIFIFFFHPFFLKTIIHSNIRIRKHWVFEYYGMHCYFIRGNWRNSCGNVIISKTNVLTWTKSRMMNSNYKELFNKFNFKRIFDPADLIPLGLWENESLIIYLSKLENFFR